METIEGYDDDRDPDTMVAVFGSRGNRYHELNEHGDPACRTCADQCEYDVMTLEVAIRKWNEPCQQEGCTSFREGQGKVYPTKAELKFQYHSMQMTPKEIAAQYGWSGEGIRSLMRRKGISLRNAGHAVSVSKQ